MSVRISRSFCAISALESIDRFGPLRILRLPAAKASPMHILRMRDAAYVRAGKRSLHRRAWTLRAGRRMTRLCASRAEAEALAMMAAALARATAGSVTIGEYDPRVQPVHCKRIAAFVPHDPCRLHRSTRQRYIAYRAALWDVDRRRRARARTASFIAQLEGLHEAFAYPIVGCARARRRNCSCSTGLKQRSFRRSSTLRPEIARC